MDISTVFRTLYAAGIVLTPAEGDGLDAEGPLTEPRRELIRQHKTNILRTLREQRIGERDPDYPSPVPRRFVVPLACRVPDVCCRLGWCGPPGTAQQCGTPATISSSPSVELRKDAA
jgi:hypothetical protein